MMKCEGIIPLIQIHLILSNLSQKYIFFFYKILKNIVYSKSFV